MVNVLDYIDPKLIVLLSDTQRDDALKSLVSLAYREGKIPEAESFYQAILEREKIVTTGIGMGVAVPHAKLQNYDRFFITIGILSEGIEWLSLDEAPVKIILMIGGPDDKQTEYLQILSGLTRLVKDEECRKRLLKAQTPDEVIKIFQSYEEGLEG